MLLNKYVLSVVLILSPIAGAVNSQPSDWSTAPALPRTLSLFDAEYNSQNKLHVVGTASINGNPAIFHYELAKTQQGSTYWIELPVAQSPILAVATGLSIDIDSGNGIGVAIALRGVGVEEDEGATSGIGILYTYKPSGSAWADPQLVHLETLDTGIANALASTGYPALRFDNSGIPIIAFHTQKTNVDNATDTSWAIGNYYIAAATDSHGSQWNVMALDATRDTPHGYPVPCSVHGLSTSWSIDLHIDAQNIRHVVYPFPSLRQSQGGGCPEGFQIRHATVAPSGAILDSATLPLPSDPYLEPVAITLTGDISGLHLAFSAFSSPTTRDCYYAHYNSTTWTEPANIADHLPGNKTVGEIVMRNHLPHLSIVSGNKLFAFTGPDWPTTLTESTRISASSATVSDDYIVSSRSVLTARSTSSTLSKDLTSLYTTSTNGNYKTIVSQGCAGAEQDDEQGAVGSALVLLLVVGFLLCVRSYPHPR